MNMQTLTFERQEPRDVEVDDRIEQVITVFGFVDGKKVIETEWPLSADDAAILDHMKVVLRARGLLDS